jgi:hypothetical protein
VCYNNSTNWIFINSRESWELQRFFTGTAWSYVPHRSWCSGLWIQTRLDRFFEKHEQKPDLRQHTKALCKEVYEPLLHIIVGGNPTTPYKIEFKVSPLDQNGNRTHRSIPVEYLPHLDRGIDHLRNYKPYQGVYRAWEEVLTLKGKYNEMVEELIQELKKLTVEKMQERFSSFSEYESSQSPEIQNYFHSDGFVDVPVIEKKICGQNLI